MSWCARALSSIYISHLTNLRRFFDSQESKSFLHQFIILYAVQETPIVSFQKLINQLEGEALARNFQFKQKCSEKLSKSIPRAVGAAAGRAHDLLSDPRAIFMLWRRPQRSCKINLNVSLVFQAIAVTSPENRRLNFLKFMNH